MVSAENIKLKAVDEHFATLSPTLPSIFSFISSPFFYIFFFPSLFFSLDIVFLYLLFCFSLYVISVPFILPLSLFLLFFVLPFLSLFLSFHIFSFIFLFLFPFPRGLRLLRKRGFENSTTVATISITLISVFLTRCNNLRLLRGRRHFSDNSYVGTLSLFIAIYARCGGKSYLA